MAASYKGIIFTTDLKQKTMKKKLYYVVEKELQSYGDGEECTGFKSISLYSINDNVPTSMGVIDGVENETKSTDAIQIYLDDNGYEDEDFEMIQL